MKLLHVVPSYLPAVRYGGPIWAVHGLCRALATRGHDVTVFTTAVDGERDAQVPIGSPVQLDGVSVHYFKAEWSRRLYFSPGMARSLRQSVGGFDMVHCHSCFLWPPWAGGRAARRAGRPYLVTPHGMLVRDLISARGWLRKTLWIRLLERTTLAHAAGIHVTSTAEADEVAALGLGAGRFHVVPFGVDPVSEVEGRYEAAGGPPTILFLGRLTWKKGLDVLIDAMSEVPAAVLVVAGNDEEGLGPRLRRRAEGQGLTGRVRFLGPVYGADKTALLRSATLFALPSRNENFAITALESLAAGTPVVLSESVGLAGDIVAAGAGLSVPASAPAFAAAIRRLLESPREREQMRAAGLRLARERYSWDEVARRMEEVISAVVRRPCPATR